MIQVVKSLISKAVQLIGKIHWPACSEISEQDKIKIKDLLVPNYYIILTRRSNHLSTYFIGLSDLILRGKWGFFGHALMNTEDSVGDPTDFRLVEAIGAGVQYTPFNEVFNVQAVALLKPKSMSVDKWTVVLDKAKTEIGKPYDTLFDLKNDRALSCVELVRAALMAEPDYNENFKNFEAMIKKYKNLTPSMFYDCPDFEVVFEVKA